MIAAILFILTLAIVTITVHIVVKVRQEVAHMEEILRMADEQHWREEVERATKKSEVEKKPVGVPAPTPVHAKPKPEVENTQKVLDFEVEPEAHRPRDPNKPKRKSPRPHNRVNNKDEFWHEVIREYFALKKKNPALTRADFVRTKNDPRIKAKTFNSKLHYMSKYGALPHKKK